MSPPHRLLKILKLAIPVLLSTSPRILNTCLPIGPLLFTKTVHSYLSRSATWSYRPAQRSMCSYESLGMASELSTEHGTLATPTAVCLSFIIDCVAAAVYPIFHSAQSLPSAPSPSPSSSPKNCGHQAHITLPSTPPISKTFPTKSPTSIRRNHTLLSRFSLKHRSKPPAKHQLHQRANRAPKNPKVSSPTQNSSLSQVMSSAAI